MIRAFRPSDILRLALAPGLRGADQVRTLDRLGDPGGGAGASWALLRQGASIGGRRCLRVVSKGGRITGMASGRPRSGPLAWEVERLLPPEDAEAEALLGGVCAAATLRGARYVYLRLPADSPVSSQACRSGFLPAFGESLLRWAAPVERPASGEPPGLGPRTPSDDLHLFRLYLACCPAGVRAACGQTLAEWRDSLESAGRPVLDRVLRPTGDAGGPAGEGRRRDLEVRAWLRAWTHRGTTIIQALADLDDAGLSDLVGYALSGLRVGGPVLALVPTYQPGLARAFLHHGFTPSAEFSVHVKTATSRVREGDIGPTRIRPERNLAPQP